MELKDDFGGKKVGNFFYILGLGLRFYLEKFWKFFGFVLEKFFFG